MKLTLRLMNLMGSLAMLSCFRTLPVCTAQLLQKEQIQPPQNRGLLTDTSNTPILGAGGACRIGQLDFLFRTGSDDLRGGSNNLNIEIHYSNGTIQLAKNVNNGANWASNSMHEVPIPLDHSVSANQIKSINLIHLAQGGYDPTAIAVGSSGAGPILPTPDMAATGIKTEDNWDMAEMDAFAPLGPGIKLVVAASGLHRFTGSNPAYSVNAVPNITCPTAGQTTELHLVFQTGNDDLRGGNDNLDVTIIGDSLNQHEVNVNRSQRWADETGQEVTVLLNRPMAINQIHQVVLQKTSQTGFGNSSNDKWNMDSLKVFAMVNGAQKLIGSQGYYQFTSSAPTNRLIVNVQ